MERKEAIRKDAIRKDAVVLRLGNAEEQALAALEELGLKGSIFADHRPHFVFNAGAGTEDCQEWSKTAKGKDLTLAFDLSNNLEMMRNAKGAVLEDDPWQALAILSAYRLDPDVIRLATSGLRSARGGKARRGYSEVLDGMIRKQLGRRAEEQQTAEDIFYIVFEDVPFLADGFVFCREADVLYVENELGEQYKVTLKTFRDHVTKMRRSP